MSMITRELPVSNSLRDDLDHLAKATVGDIVMVVGVWKPIPIEKATAKFVTIAGVKFRRENGDLVCQRWAGGVQRILPLTTRTAQKMEIES